MQRVLSILFISTSFAFSAVDFESQVQPILVDHCLKCHRKDNKKSDYKLMVNILGKAMEHQEQLIPALMTLPVAQIIHLQELQHHTSPVMKNTVREQ